MSKGARICFDASIQESRIGIGVYNDNNKTKIHKSYNIKLKYHESYKAEFIGLVTALEYCYTENIVKPKLFTDNLELAKRGVPDYLKEKYGTAELYWIPREFNRVADKLSKTSKNVSKSLKKEGQITRGYILNLDYKKKLKLIKALATSEFRKEFLHLLKKGKVKDFQKYLSQNYRAKIDTSFLSLVYELKIYDSVSAYTQKRKVMDYVKKVNPITNSKINKELEILKLSKDIK